MGCIEVNKILINAARYLDAMHDIKIDENNPRLDSIIRKHVLELETPQLINYWKDYLADIDVENERTSIQESVVEIEKIEKAIYYRGVKVEQPATAKTDNTEEVLYRGQKQAGKPESTERRNKSQPVYRGVKSD